MAVRQCYGRRERHLGIGLYRWIASEACLVLGRWWFGNVERMGKDRIAKRFYVGEWAGNRSMGNPRKRWIDTVKDSLRKRGLDVRQVR